MIQFNLLPDVKQKYIKAERSQRLVVLIAAIITLATIGVLIILVVVVDGLQKKNISDLSRDIKTQTSNLQKTPNLNKILTVQNQLKALPALDASKPVITRSFGYLQQITPTTATISSAEWILGSNTLMLSGSADSFATVNTFVDTLKFTTYSPANNSNNISPFTNVILNSFSQNGNVVDYAISLTFNPIIFNSTSTNSSMTVPSKVTTRSVLDQDSLFQAPTTSNSSSSNGGQ